MICAAAETLILFVAQTPRVSTGGNIKSWRLFGTVPGVADTSWSKGQPGVISKVLRQIKNQVDPIFPTSHCAVQSSLATLITVTYVPAVKPRQTSVGSASTTWRVGEQSVACSHEDECRENRGIMKRT